MKINLKIEIIFKIQYENIIKKNSIISEKFTIKV